MHIKVMVRIPILTALLFWPVILAAQKVDPRGPITGYAGRIQLRDDGIALTGDEMVPSGAQIAAKPSWKPNWISLSDAEQTRPMAIRLRKEFTLPTDQPVQSATATISADCFYRLWINGILVSRGPDDPGNDYSPHDRWSHQWLANQLNITLYLHPGVNVIAAEVFRAHREDYSLGTTGFAFRISAAGKVGSPPIVVESGQDWMAKRVDAYSIVPLVDVQQSTEAPANGLRYDARLDEPRWRDAGFSGEGWSPAKVIPSLWGSVALSRLPSMMEAAWPIMQISRLHDLPLLLTYDRRDPSDSNRPRQFSVLGDGRFLVKYDRVLSGYISLELQGTSGTTVTVWPRESISDAPGRRPFEIVIGRGITRFESPTLESFSALEIDVANATGPIQFRDIRANFVSQPVVYRGSFTSSDEALNVLWRAARWQTQICLQNRFLDSPDHQEPIGDPGDYLIEAKVADYAFGPIAMTPQFLRQFSAILDHWMADHSTGSPNFHTSYSLLWLQTLLDYYDETGNAALPRELAPSAYRLLARYSQWVGANGILSEAPNYLFMDWVTIDGLETHHPPAVIGQGYLTAFYYRGLSDGIRLAQLTGDSKRVAQYREQQSSLRKAFNRELWDAKAGLYRDGKPFLNHNPTSANFLPPDSDIETFSPHVNVLAVLYDLAPRGEQAKILARTMMLKRASPAVTTQSGQPDPLGALNVQPYFMHFVFAAEAHAGVLGLYAPAQLARWTVNPQTQTFREMWTRGDWSHGWGGTPLIQMSSHVLGVSPGSPGYATILLAPVPLGLTFAKGRVPTPRGDVLISWKRSGDRFTYEATMPANTRGMLNLYGIDNARSMRVSVDGSVGKLYRAPIMLNAGSHQVVLYSGHL